MLFSSLTTHCIDRVLSYLTKKEVAIFAEVFPEHQDAIESYWKKILSLNLVDMAPGELEALLANISQCTNLTVLTASGPLPYKVSGTDLITIATHCPALEKIKIPAIELTPSRTVFLRSCANLKTLHLTVPIAGRGGPVPELILSNDTQLERLSILELRIFGDTLKTDFFADDHRSFVLSKCGIVSLTRLYTTGLPFMRAVTDNQTSLKTFCTNYGDDAYLEKVFSNNQQLINVMVIVGIITGSCLRHLPTTVKRLHLYYCYNIDYDMLMECLQRLDLEILGIDVCNKPANFLEELVTALPTLQHLSIRYHRNNIWSLESVKDLKQLTTLRISRLHGDHSDELTRITDSCVNLEMLDIKGDVVQFKEYFIKSIAALPKLEDVRFLYLYDFKVNNLTPLIGNFLRIPTSLPLRIYSIRLIDEAVEIVIRKSTILTKLEMFRPTFTQDLKEGVTKLLDLSYPSITEKDIEELIIVILEKLKEIIYF